MIPRVLTALVALAFAHAATAGFVKPISVTDPGSYGPFNDGIFRASPNLHADAAGTGYVAPYGVSDPDATWLNDDDGKLPDGDRFDIILDQNRDLTKFYLWNYRHDTGSFSVSTFSLATSSTETGEDFGTPVVYTADNGPGSGATNGTVDAHDFPADNVRRVRFTILTSISSNNLVGINEFAFEDAVVSPPPPATAGRTRVFLLAGQSNMQGLGYNSELTPPYDAPQTDVSYWSGGTWVDLAPGFGYQGDMFGPEVSFGRAIKDALTVDTIHLVKYAVSGTALYNDWAPPSGPQYTGFMNTANAALANLDAAGVDYEIAGILWMQGESDAHENQAASYETNLRNFIADMRVRFSDPDLPFIVARVRDYFGGASGQAAIVRAAQVAVADTTAGVEWFDTDTYPLSTAHPGHYDTQGQLSLGLDFADTYLATGPPGTFAAWADDAGLDGSAGREDGFSDNPDGDGLDNGLEWILGGNPLVCDSAANMPVMDLATNSALNFKFTREEDSIGRATLEVEWDTDLDTAWAHSIPIDEPASGIHTYPGGITVEVDASADPDQITVTIPETNAPGGKLFVRLKATLP
jgi:hypothetical protein